MKHLLPKLQRAARSVVAKWPTARVAFWSRRMKIGFAILAPLSFAASVALSIYDDNEGMRLTLEEANLDIPTAGVYALIGCAILSLLLTAVFSVIEFVAKACMASIPR